MQSTHNYPIPTRYLKFFYLCFTINVAAKVVKFTPGNASVRLSLAKLLLDQQQTKAAIDVLTEAHQPYHSQVSLV